MDTRYNVLVIGAGSGGLISAYMSAAVKAKVGLIERHKMGGDCLNTGCVPSKALIRTARFVHDMKRHEELGVAAVDYQLDFKQIMRRVQNAIRAIEPHDSTERYTQLGVECIEGHAEILDPWTVRVGKRHLQAKNLILALGASPLIPSIKGLAQIKALTSENIWQLEVLPRRLLVLGGGAIGSELAQAFARLGSEVTQIEMQPRILPREDEDMALLVQQSMQRDGVKILTATEALEVRLDAQGEKTLLCRGPDGREYPLGFDELLLAVGRRPNTGGVDWAKLGIKLQPNGSFQVDAYLRTTQKHIYAAGDCVGPYQFTHAASHQAWYAAMNALFSPILRFKIDYRVLPWCTFTDPEIAQVGLNEQAAREQHIAYEVTRYQLSDLDRAITDSEAYGAIKVLTVPGKDQILGVTICGHLAGECIGEFVLAMKHGLGLRSILGTIHAYPTFIEANKAAAGAWARARVPEWGLGILKTYHGWRRS